MNTRDYLSKIHTGLQDYNTYKPHIYNPTSVIVNDACTLVEYMHFQHIIDKATMEFLQLPKNTRTLLFYGSPNIHKPDCPLHPIVSGCDGPTELTIYLPKSPILSSPQLAIFHHIAKAQNIISTLLENFHPSHPMPSWSQVMSRPHTHTQTFHTKKAQQPRFTLWKNTSTYYPQTVHLPIWRASYSISSSNIALLNSWTRIYTKSLAPPPELGWLPGMTTYSWARRKAPQF